MAACLRARIRPSRPLRRPQKNPAAGLTGSKTAIALVAALAIFSAGASVPSRAATAPQVFQFALQNGMQVLVIPDHRAPVVTQMVWFKVGSVDDPPGVSGLAHFFEHMMFRGTKKV